MAGKKNMHHRREARRERAVELREERSKRTDQQQLNHLDKMFGNGKGAQKERGRLLSKIAALQENLDKQPADEVKPTKKEKTKAKERRKSSKRNASN